MRKVQATVTRLKTAWSPPNTTATTEEQVGIQVIAGVVTFQQEDGTLMEIDKGDVLAAMEDE